jgi:ribonuclease-3
MVSRETCARVARAAELGPALRLSASSSKIGGRETDSILAGAAEALMAALYQDGGLDAARKVFLTCGPTSSTGRRGQVRAIPRPRCRNGRKGKGKPLPTYACWTAPGPTTRRCSPCRWPSGVDPAIAKGKSRQEAEKAAAKALLEREGAE